jgi:hypothetical protein
MLVTFYLSGPYSSTTVSSEFTIVGNPGAETFTGITKAQLLAGHPLTFSESVTGGTVTTTEPETCVGTVVNWFVELQPTPTPTVTPTPTATVPPLYEFYHSNQALSPLGHCDQNQVTSALFYSSSTTISGMLGTTVYDNAQDPWVGGEFYYAVSSENTFNTNDQPYYVIQVDNFGLVTDVQYIADCSGGGAIV